MNLRDVVAVSALALAASAMAAQAELAVSANDGKQVRPGDVPAGPTPDSVSVIDLGHYPPKLLGSVDAPASMIGPPASVVVAPDQSFAIVTASQKPNPADPAKPIPNDVVSVISLKSPAHPKVVQSLTAGPGASGISINKAATLALVASTGDDTVTVFSIADGRLSPAGKVQLDAKARPTDVVFTPVGKNALVVAQGASKLVELSVNGTHVAKTGVEIAPGRQPYGAVITHDGKYVITTNLGGAMDTPPPAPGHHGPRIGTVSVSDLASHKVVSSVEVGPIPEHVALSADGRYLEVTVANGSASTKTDPTYNSVFGLMKVFRVDGAKLDPVATTNTGHWCQGATWSDDGRTILLQCATEREIEVYRFDGNSLKQDKSATISFRSRPGAISTARSR
jgi:DNA-binding beta-propeller fold protein YncE